MFKNLENQLVPKVSFNTMYNGRWQVLTTEDIFRGKNIIVFALPGAFTPTCSSAHVPRYSELFSVFKQHGIDSIVCISVNDTFVMNAWKNDQKAQNIDFIPDGNGEFSAKMGMLVDKTDLGFGKRSWRYAMLVKNGVIDKMFIEPNKPGDPFEVSDADTMLNYIAPNAKLPKEVTIFTKSGCPHCTRAKKLLAEHGQTYEEVVLGGSASIRTIKALTGTQTVPQIYIDGQHIGGADNLEAYFVNSNN